MRRMKMMTLGFVLILFGIQLNLLNAVELTPRFSTFLSEQGTNSPPYVDSFRNGTPFSQASYGREISYTNQIPQTKRVVVIPDWLCWPTFFLGAVLVLQGAIKQD